MMSRTPSRKPRWKSTYRARSASQKARFCESNAPSVMTGSSTISFQYKPSADAKAYSPPSPLAIALYFAPASAAGFASRNGAKLWEPSPSQTMLFAVDL